MSARRAVRSASSPLKKSFGLRAAQIRQLGVAESRRISDMPSIRLLDLTNLVALSPTKHFFNGLLRKEPPPIEALRSVSRQHVQDRVAGGPRGAFFSGFWRSSEDNSHTVARDGVKLSRIDISPALRVLPGSRPPRLPQALKHSQRKKEAS